MAILPVLALGIDTSSTASWVPCGIEKAVALVAGRCVGYLCPLRASHERKRAHMRNPCTREHLRSGVSVSGVEDAGRAMGPTWDRGVSKCSSSVQRQAQGARLGKWWWSQMAPVGYPTENLFYSQTRVLVEERAGERWERRSGRENQHT